MFAIVSKRKRAAVDETQGVFKNDKFELMQAGVESIVFCKIDMKSQTAVVELRSSSKTPCVWARKFHCDLFVTILIACSK